MISGLRSTALGQRCPAGSLRLSALSCTDVEGMQVLWACKPDVSKVDANTHCAINLTSPAGLGSHVQLIN